MKSVLLITALLISSTINAHSFYNNNGFFNNGFYNNAFRGFDSQFQQLNRRMQHLKQSNNSYRAQSKRFLDQDTNEYVIEIKTTNINKDNLSIDIDNNIISIKGETKTEQKSGNNTTISSSHFSQSFSLPLDADKNNITANFEENVLTIRIPRSEQQETSEQVIEIN
ncbi:MAG: Hsp20 family protein [Candidatus Thioglobus sp.]